MAAQDDGGLPGVGPIRDREPVDPARLGELWAGRIFEHKTLTSPSRPEPQLCRIVSWTKDRVSFHEIHRRPDGTERPPRVDPWNVPIRTFFEFDLGEWHQGPLPPVAGPTSGGYDLPMSAKKPPSSGPGRG